MQLDLKRGRDVVTLDECGWLGPACEVESPPAELVEVAEHVFTLDITEATQRSWLVLPDPAWHLLLQRRPATHGGWTVHASVVGARTRGVRIDVRGRAWTVGVRFRPGTIGRLTGLVADELTDRSAAPGELWGSSGAALERRVLDAETPDEARRVALSFVEALTADHGSQDWRARGLTELAVETNGAARVHEVAARLGLSERALRGASRREIGISPKRLLRILRLYSVVEATRADPDPRWTRVAHAAGLADQPHLSREFRSLVGESVTRFHARGRRRTERADSYKRSR